MKLISGFFSILLIAGVGGLFFLKTPTGGTWLSKDDFIPNVPETVKHIQRQTMRRLQKTEQTAETQGDVIYRWRDKQGAWQFSDSPPEDMKNVEQLHIDPDRNMIRGVVLPTPEVEDSVPSQKFHLPFPTTIPPGDIPKLIEDAKGLQELVDKRQQQLDSTLNEK